MEDKTIIVRPKKPSSEVSKPSGKNTENKVKVRKIRNTTPGKTPSISVKREVTVSSFPAFILAALAFLLIGAGSAITVIYLLTSGAPRSVEITEKELSADLVAVQSDASAAEDEALIKAAIEPRIIELSGDPVVVRQLGSAMRQMIKLDKDIQRKAARDLGIGNDVFRFKDVLDVPTPGLQAGVVGSQEDIATLQQASGQNDSAEISNNVGNDNGEGSSIVATIGNQPFNQTVEFAQEVKSAAKISNLLNGLGLDSARVSLAEEAFSTFYAVRNLKKGERFAVRAIPDPEKENQLSPVQVSVYSPDKLIGSIALNDLDAFSKSEDPWYKRDVFETALLPPELQPENQPRLLDAIYAAALRNRLPTDVTGEAIMLASRSQDLEQKVQAGDTITLVYSAEARDAKTGLGRVVYLSIGRTSGNLDCYVIQPSAGAKFECVSLAGESSVGESGMVMPVNGIIVAKFGPQGATESTSGQMNFGVDWTAPKGSPVVAAFAGNVTAAGPESGLGNVVRLTHPDGKSTMYGYLQRVNLGVSVGGKVGAGQVIGFVGTGPSSREPRLHFELMRNGVPVDPIGEMQADSDGGSSGGGAVDKFVHRIIYIESGNRCNASNPLSTAVGLGQFIESTWMTTIRLHRPDLLPGRSRRQILDMRTNCELARAMTTAFTRDNAAVLRKAGRTVTPGNLYLAHFLGVGGASKVLGSHPDRQIADVFGTAHVRANPFERGKSIGYLVAWAAKKMSGKVPAKSPVLPSNPAKDVTEKETVVASTGNSEPLTRYAADPAFAKLRAAVVSFLQ
jgi:murein DD-endopeptidase MepM/ murein hydrolase activator NlpD